MMTESGVDMLLHAWFLDALHDGANVIGARVATIAGTRELRAPRVIDATADALIAASAGAPTVQGDGGGRVQPASLMFRLSHVDRAALAAYVRARPEQMRSSLTPDERTPESLTAVAGLYELWEAAKRPRRRHRAARACLVLRDTVRR